MKMDADGHQHCQDGQGKNYHYIAFLVNFSEDCDMVYIQRALMENCGIFSGQNEAPIARHSDGPS